MRHYTAGAWGIRFIFSLRGSVVCRACAWAIPNAIIAFICHYCLRKTEYDFVHIINDDISANQVWQGYNFLIAFLLTFRTGQAYARWWEGGSLLQQARGEWFNAYSSLIAFCNADEEYKTRVKHFQEVLAMLMSMLHCASLQQISQAETEAFEVLEFAALRQESMEFLQSTADKVEIIYLWIQRHIVNGMHSRVLNIEAPVLTRVFYELSRGVVGVNEVRKIAEFLFPFPYAQLVTIMLLLHFSITPLVCAILIQDWYWAVVTSFISVFALWSLNYVACEIECPFGDDINDLPLHAMQRHMNRTLVLLLDWRAQQKPDIHPDDLEEVDAAEGIARCLFTTPKLRRAFKSVTFTGRADPNLEKVQQFTRLVSPTDSDEDGCNVSSYGSFKEIWGPMTSVQKVTKTVSDRFSWNDKYSVTSSRGGGDSARGSASVNAKGRRAPAPNSANTSRSVGSMGPSPRSNAGGSSVPTQPSGPLQDAALAQPKMQSYASGSPKSGGPVPAVLTSQREAGSLPPALRQAGSHRPGFHGTPPTSVISLGRESREGYISEESSVASLERRTSPGGYLMSGLFLPSQGSLKERPNSTSTGGDGTTRVQDPQNSNSTGGEVVHIWSSMATLSDPREREVATAIQRLRSPSDDPEAFIHVPSAASVRATSPAMPATPPHGTPLGTPHGHSHVHFVAEERSSGDTVRPQSAPDDAKAPASLTARAAAAMSAPHGGVSFVEVVGREGAGMLSPQPGLVQI